ncbi:MAG: TetR/AcrR family transcriptional regulator [Alteromonadaceae bacterium]|nr:TetR/AcrR family transcriptional regulator [Alteromonadaceae bacterium]
MAYRETPKIRDRKAATREKLLSCALTLVAEEGFRKLQMSQLATTAGVATGTLYRYFPSKEKLFAEVFQRATQTEVDRVGEALTNSHGEAPERIQQALRIFARRALKAPKLAWALIAEPVEPEVDQQRLEYRLRYAQLFANAIEQGIHEGSIPNQPAMLTSTAIVGAISEALIGPLVTTTSANHVVNTADQRPQVINHILRFCIQGLLATHEPCAGQVNEHEEVTL